MRAAIAPLQVGLAQVGLEKDVSWHAAILQPPTPRLYDLVTARYEQAPIVLTSNRSFAEWGALLGDEVLATALLGRLLHHAEVITINGQSYRMKDRRLAPSPLEKEATPD